MGKNWNMWFFWLEKVKREKWWEYEVKRSDWGLGMRRKRKDKRAGLFELDKPI